MPRIIFPAEWSPQSAVQLTWPHPGTDWAPCLDAVTRTYVLLAKEILRREKLLIVCQDAGDVKSHFSMDEQQRIFFAEIDSNDTWARDHGPISLFVDDKPSIADFGFNGWGLKFAANKDNRITSKLFKHSLFSPDVVYIDRLNFILEGGSVESDGEGTLLTTTYCLMSPYRNQSMSKDEIDLYLKRTLGVDRVLWLNHGALEGDDTDSHIDTLARFCDPHTIAYVKCVDPSDSHFSELKKMEEELKQFVDRNGRPYRLVALPMADAVFDDGQRLPATYANFLIINGAVLVPFYGTDKDQMAKKILEEVFPSREVAGIDCRPLIRQHGSLHCAAMQYPVGFF